MKKLFALILALVMSLSLFACGSSKTKMRFVTGSESGTYYAFGSTIAQHATNNAGIDVVGLVGNGSKSNVEELDAGNAELAFCQSDVMAYAYNGTNIFDKKIDCFSTVAALYAEQVQIVTVDPSIKTVADLEGKNVSVGQAGSGVYFNAVDILSAYGIGDLDADGKFTKINATYQSFGDSADALKDGKIDAAFIVAGAPTTSITELDATAEFDMISLTPEAVEYLTTNYPFLVQEDLPAGTYPNNIDYDVTCVAVKAVLVASEDLSEDFVYELLTQMFENQESMAATQAKFQFLTLENAVAGVGDVPMHPGAEKFYTEKGVL